MKRFLLALALVAAAPAIAPDHAAQATADDAYATDAYVVYVKSFPFIKQYTWYQGGWVLTNVQYDMSIGF